VSSYRLTRLSTTHLHQLRKIVRSIVLHLFVFLIENVLVDYADLAIIDLSKANTAEGSAELAMQVTKAMTTHGFFYAD
jgi:hypothetical protein